MAGAIQTAEDSPPKSSKIANQLVGTLPHQAAAIVSNAVASRGWRNLADGDREMVLATWVGDWQLATMRPDPVRSAVRVFDARRLVKNQINGTEVVANLGPTHFHSLTYAERDEYLADAQACKRAAELARDLAWGQRVFAAGEGVDRQIAYSPTAPDRSGEHDGIVRGREELRQALAKCAGKANVIGSADLLGYHERSMKDELVWDEAGVRRPEWLDRLSIRLAMIARNLTDKARLADGVPTQPAPSKKKNAATKALLTNLAKLGLDKDEFAEVKRVVATMIVYRCNLRFSSGSAVPLFNLQAELCDRCGKGLLTPGRRCPDDACQQRREAEREERRQDAVDDWLGHFLNISGSERRRRRL